jgi:predicted phosphodiesterase
MPNKYNIPESFETPYEDYLLPKVHKKLLILPDVHVPYHNYDAINTTFDFCQDKSIDSILLNGDFMDCYQMSKFVKDPRKRNFKEELSIAGELIDAIQKTFPDAKLFFKEGNHEERYEKYLMMKAAELLGIEEYGLDNLLKLYARGVAYIRDQRTVRVGKFPVFHGHEYNMKNTTVNPARTLFLRTKASALCSHLHVPSFHSGKREDDHVISCYSTGHLSEEHPPYARKNEWILGFAIIDFDPTHYEVSNYKIIHNKVWRS